MPTELTPERAAQRFAKKAPTAETPVEPRAAIPFPEAPRKEGAADQRETGEPNAEAEAPPAEKKKRRGKKPEPLPAEGLAVTMEVKRLKALLKRVMPAREGRATLPALSCVLLEMEMGSAMSARMTNLDQEIETSESVEEIEGHGRVLVDAKRLMALVDKAEAEQISLKVIPGERLRVRCGEWSAELCCLPPENFPDKPQWDRMGEFQVPAGRLKRMLTLAGAVMSTDETRYVLNGLHISALNDVLCVVGTDGRALVRCEMEWRADAGWQFIIPSKAVGVMRGLLDDSEKAATVFLCRKDGESEQPHALEILLPDGTWLRTVLIEGNYPNVQQVIPPDGAVSCTLDRAGFAAMVDRACVMAERSNHTVELAFATDGTVNMHSAMPDCGEWREVRSLCTAAGAPERGIRFNANAHYLMNAGGPLCDSVHLSTATEMPAPLKFTAREPAAEWPIDWLLIMMPMSKAEAKPAAAEPEGTNE